MSPIVYTMPEAKFRTTKKRAAGDLRKSEFAHELKAFKPRQAQEAGVPPEAAAASKRKPGRSLTVFWPVAVGLFLAGFAPEWQAMASQAGIWATRFAFPLSLVAMRRELGFNAQSAAMLAQFAVFAQLPLDGAWAALILAQGKSLKTVVAQLFSVHVLCGLVLSLLTFVGN